MNVQTDKTKDVSEGIYIGPDYKPTIFTPKERLILLLKEGQKHFKD